MLFKYQTNLHRKIIRTTPRFGDDCTICKRVFHPDETIYKTHSSNGMVICLCLDCMKHELVTDLLTLTKIQNKIINFISKLS